MDGSDEGSARARALGVLLLVAAITLGSGVSVSLAQTPATPAQPGQTPAQEQPSSPAQPTPAQEPIQQFQIQQPGRPPLTPATPPGTTLPPWTPPVPPPPSQTNVPAPFPGTPGLPGFVGVPGLTIPGAFGPTVTTVRGALLEFHPTLRVTEEYSDNFFQTSSRARDNFRTTFGPGFTMLLNGARTFGTLSLTADLVHDTADNSGDEIKVFPSLSAAVRYTFTPRLSLTVTENFVRNDEASAADQFGIRSGRRTFNTNTAGATVDWLLDQVATQAYYRNVLFFNEDADGAGDNATNENDTITHILGLNASTRVFTDYIIRAGYEFARTDDVGGTNGDGVGGNDGDDGGDTTTHTVFGSASRRFGLYASGGVSTTASFQSQDNTRVYNVSLFGAYGLPTGLSLSASVGYSILDSDERDTEGTISANVNASYRFTRAVISVGVFQDFRQTAQQGQNFGTVESRSYFGSFLYQLTPFINALAQVTYTENEPTGTGNNDNAGTQTSLTYGASLNWRVLRWLTASLQYTHTRQTGAGTFNQNVGGKGDFAENRATLSLFATF